jgi:hypothetical protein
MALGYSREVGKKIWDMKKGRSSIAPNRHRPEWIYATRALAAFLSLAVFFFAFAARSSRT